MQLAKRLEKIPPYLFAELNRKGNELAAKGVDIINMAVGDPDRPTPDRILRAMHEAIDDPSTHNYPPYQGTQAFREAAAAWMERRFGVTGLNPNTEIVSAIGSKEAIHNTFLAFVDPGDTTLIPDPGYPVYRTSTIFAGGEPYTVPLSPENGFLPDLDAIPEQVATKAKLLWVNYPNNPTGAVANLEDFEKMVAFCRKYDIMLCHDNAYSEMAYDAYKPPSVLQVPGAMDVAMSVYQKRRDIIVEGLQSLGWKIQPPKATLYVWVPVPEGYTSTEFVTLLLDKCGIMVPPGNGYGAGGEGFFRIALTVPDQRMREGIQRMKDAGIRYA